MIPFNIIVAVDSKFGIGRGGALPWNIPRDMKHFKAVTSKANANGKQNAVVLGRKTWESIPDKFRPLPDRLNVVISQRRDLSLPEGVIQVKDFSEALQTLKEREESIGEVFVIGGAKVFNEAVFHPDCRRIYLTQIEEEFVCDTFFPLDLNQYAQANRSQIHNDNDLPFYFCEFERQKS